MNVNRIGKKESLKSDYSSKDYRLQTDEDTTNSLKLYYIKYR